MPNLEASIAGTRVAIVDADTGDVIEETDHGTVEAANEAFKRLHADLTDAD